MHLQIHSFHEKGATSIYTEVALMGYTFDTGIPMTIQWYLDNKEWWENIISGEYQNYFEKMYVEKGRAKE